MSININVRVDTTGELTAGWDGADVQERGRYVNMDCLGGGFLGHRALEEAGGPVTRQRVLSVSGRS